VNNRELRQIANTLELMKKAVDKEVFDNLNDLYDIMLDTLEAIEKMSIRLKKIEDKLDKIKKDL
jgi:hypothetical protein